MAIPKRHGRLPGTYFVTSRTWESRHLFVTKPICQIFVETLFHYRDEGAYDVHSFVLMPEHFHVLLTPSSSTALERVAQLIKGGSAFRIKKELKFGFPVWQRGFSDRRIRDGGDYEIHVQYIEQNPVERDLVRTASEYPWLSVCGRYRLDDPPQRLKPRPEVSLAARLKPCPDGPHDSAYSFERFAKTVLVRH